MILGIREEELTLDWIIDNINYLITEHNKEQKRIKKLQEYYQGKHDILDRVMSNVYVANNKLINNFPRYISTVAVGYFMGNPISYQASDLEYKKQLDTLKDIMRRNDVESVDVDLSSDLSITGVGYEYLTVIDDYDGTSMPKSYALPPERTFVCVDNTVEATPLMGIYYLDSQYKSGMTIPGKIIVATKDYIYTLSLKERGNVVDVLDSKEHYYGIVPIIEYKNNAIKQGDYEGVITLIDAYNTLQSDRVNDKEQLIDAILMLKGVNLEDANVVDNIKENRILVLPENGDAEWLTKQLNEQDTNILRKNLEEDIHKFSLTPNITDDQFSGNASGVAMQYKLFAFEQLIKTKERFFQESLRNRLIAYLEILRKSGSIKSLSVNEIEVIFNRNMPQDNIEIGQLVSQLNGVVSKETLLSQVPFVKDVDIELTRLKKQKKEEQDSLQSSFGFPNKVGENNEETGEESDSNEVGTGEL